MNSWIGELLVTPRDAEKEKLKCTRRKGEVIEIQDGMVCPRDSFGEKFERSVKIVFLEQNKDIRVDILTVHNCARLITNARPFREEDD